MLSPQLLSLLADLPPDSKAGQAAKAFVGFLFADAKHGGAVGGAFKAAVDAALNPADTCYLKMSPMDAAALQGTLNGLKGFL